MKPETLKKKYITYSIPKLKEIADDIFSIYVRTLYSKDGLVECYTCRRKFPIKGIDNGHFVSRTCSMLRYDPRNCRPQCQYDNRFKEGMKDEFALRLEAENPGILKELNTLKHLPFGTWKQRDLIDIILRYKELGKTLLENKY